jgi:hypothetical protein
MKRLLLWVAVPLMLLGAAMLIADIGATALWIAVIAVGIALVAIGQVKPSATDDSDAPGLAATISAASADAFTIVCYQAVRLPGQPVVERQRRCCHGTLAPPGRSRSADLRFP